MTAHHRRSAGPIAVVAPGGPASRAGIRAGDALLAIDGKPVRDVLDVAWLEADGPRRVTIAREGAAVDLDVEPTGCLGLTFATSVFDGVKVCRNRCVFCFVGQLPRGSRAALRLKDDDYRWSFLYGNFITLTNLGPDDLDRIVEQRLSPLYVSWHASDPAVRARLFGVDGRGLRQAERALERLAQEGITMHLQVVLCPGINDGPVLETTLEDLWERGPKIASVGVVPVGRSAIGERARAPRPPTADEARRLLDQLAPRQRRAIRERGEAWVWAADEYYLLAGADFPPVSHYADFAQSGNGIGIARRFLAGVRRATASGRRLPPATATLLTGELAAPVLGEAAARVEQTLGVRLSVAAVPNRLFGGAVTATGLLGGRELLAAIEPAASRGPVLVPDVVFEPDGLTLDDVPASEILAAGGGAGRIVPSDGVGFIRFLRDGTWMT